MNDIRNIENELTVIDALIKRIQFYQESKFYCVQNDTALSHLKSALFWLSRSVDLEKSGVEGTHDK